VNDPAPGPARDADARDAHDVARRLAEWASARFGGAVEVAGSPAPISGGLDSYLHAIELSGGVLPAEWRGPLVVRLLPSTDREEQARREAAVQRWCASVGFPVPVVLDVFAPGEVFDLPTQVMRRVPGRTLLAEATKRPWTTPRLIDRLAATADRLHRLPTEGWPGPAEPTASVDQRLSLPRRAVETLDQPDLRRALDRAERAAVDAIGGERVVCHGDFHPLNVLVDGDDLTVLDWTDASLGPREADVSRTLLLFNVAHIGASNRAERAALRAVGPWLERRYRRAYTSRASLDPDRLARWEVLHLVHGWAQVEMLRAGAFDGETSASTDAVPSNVATFLKQRFEQAATAVGV
jgi:aminoglycoside phosphotransferase (APT) family kinase protein